MDSDYQPRLQRALQYICAHLDRPLSLAEVAKEANLSEFHFHRIFRTIVGEPVGQFVTRKRLESGALWLAYQPRRSVTDIALDCGYSSTANFSKAFSSFFGCSPTEIRNPGHARPLRVGKLLSKYGKDFHPRDLYGLPMAANGALRRRRLDALCEGLRFVSRARFSLACLDCSGGFDFESQMRTWADLILRVRALGLSGDAVDAWGIEQDNPTLTAPPQMRYHAAVPCPADATLPSPRFRTDIPAGRFAVFRYDGPVTGVADTYRDIYSLWLPDSGLELDDFVPLDRYVDDWPKDGQVGMEMWIKVVSP